MRKTDETDARYDIVEHEAAVVRELFRRYTEDDASIAQLCRWLESAGVVTRSGKTRWDRTTVWGMLRNPAYVARPRLAGQPADAVQSGAVVVVDSVKQLVDDITAWTDAWNTDPKRTSGSRPPTPSSNP